MRDFGDQGPHPLAGRPGLPQNVRNALAEAEAAAPEIVRVSAATRPHDPATPVLVAVLRDEAAAVAGFLAHYRRLGVTRFALIDNGSTDATPARLAAAPDVDLWSVARPFQGKQGWVQALIARYGFDRWYLHVDADERLVFDGGPAPGPSGPGGPGSATAGVPPSGSSGRSLADLVRWAEGRGLRRLRGMLVDMYAPGPLLAPAPPPLRPTAGAPPDADLAARFPLFDGAGHDETLVLGRISRKGGPRRRCFPGLDPELTKYPLFHIRAAEVVACPHQLYPYPDNYTSDCHLGLLHYKFGADFHARAVRARAEGNYWEGSREYVCYLQALETDPGLTLAWPGSRRYTGPAALLAAGLIAPIGWSGATATPGRRRGSRLVRGLARIAAALA